MASISDYSLTTPSGTLRPALPNVIVLTSGLTGSSVLTGLISRAGFWTGRTTVKKEYDTFENCRLVALNRQIIDTSGYRGNYLIEYSEAAIDGIAAMPLPAEGNAYAAFIAECETCRPWIWKDPRLWLTIRYWSRIAPLRDCKFVMLTRNLKHSWVSCTLRRQIRSYQSLCLYELSIQRSIRSFIQSEGLTYLHLTYEQLIATPEQAIGELNSYIGANLSVEDLRAVYQGRLYTRPRSSIFDFGKAMLIYLKNYSQKS